MNLLNSHAIFSNCHLLDRKVAVKAVAVSSSCFSSSLLPNSQSKYSGFHNARTLIANHQLAPAKLNQEKGYVCKSTFDEESGSNYNKEFGYSRKDVILIGAGLIALGYALYYSLQAFGLEPGIAGNWVQLIIFLGICVGWVSTYVFRVATKQMTYVKQLEQYEDAVMKKRLEEMTDAEVNQLVTEVDKEKSEKKPPTA